MSGAGQTVVSVADGSGRLAEVLEHYPQRLTRHLEQLIAAGEAGVARQFDPDPLELETSPGHVPDPLAEQQHTPLPGLVHRHADRALLLATDRCAALCRFCFRKGRSFENYAQFDAQGREALFAYLQQHRELREVILTGGDPLLLPAESLAELLSRLRGIPHLQLLRLHTRLPVVSPEKVTPGLVSMLQGDPPLFVMLHVNHPAELTPELAAACRLLSDAGLPLGSQTVLLKGVNDDHTVLERLFVGLLRLRIRPYYLHHPDLAAGTAHFRVTLERGRKLFSELAGRVSGLALPHYVVDLPGGYGKVPVAEQALVAEGGKAVLRAPDGRLVKVANSEG